MRVLTYHEFLILVILKHCLFRVLAIYFPQQTKRGYNLEKILFPQRDTAVVYT